jgi:hypothetical protein
MSCTYGDGVQRVNAVPRQTDENEVSLGRLVLFAQVFEQGAHSFLSRPQRAIALAEPCGEERRPIRLDPIGYRLRLLIAATGGVGIGLALLWSNSRTPRRVGKNALSVRH